VRTVFGSVRCAGCGLVYRNPTRTPPSFYSAGYLENTVWWQDYQSGALARDAAHAFRGTKWDYYDKISLLQSVIPSGRTLDFGGGSGVIAYQLQECGFDADLFEVSEESGTIAREVLQVPTITDVETLRTRRGEYDLILLHHVLEHVDDLRALFDLLDHVLAPGGIVWCFVPNAGATEWRDAPETVLDAAHVCAFEPEFFHRNLRTLRMDGVVFSTPYAFAGDDAAAETTRDARGRELAVAAWRINSPTPAALESWPYHLPDLRRSLRAQAGC
jgi:2-polyprenyl-3-methyl-5-hydroxy-6-metoxy-1,4-benzoquinol methylase